MVDLSTAISMGSLFLSLSDRDQAMASSEDGNGTAGDQAVGDTTESKLDELIEIEHKNRPSPADKDAYATAVISLSNGEVAEVVIEPASGWNLRVKDVYFDRREGHEYEINVGGDVTSVSHRAAYTSPRTVTQSDRVVATVINDSGTDSVVDFEMKAWAERPASDGVK